MTKVAKVLDKSMSIASVVILAAPLVVPIANGCYGLLQSLLMPCRVGLVSAITSVSREA